MTEPHLTAVLRDISSQLPAEYELLEFLGEGGHGLVLKALHKPLQQFVAIKILKNDHSEEMAKCISRLQNEARVLAKLKHPNIVKVLQMGQSRDGTPFLVCEYLEGITLAQYLTKNPHPGPKDIAEIFTQILDSLQEAHENGLLHRDIKPSNIMLLTEKENESFVVKLLDFGIARDFSSLDAQPLGLTRTIQISGSAPYMSPEQCQGRQVDQRSDIYSVACVLYQCLAGAPPFIGETPMHTRYMQIHEEARIPSEDKFAHTSSRLGAYKLVISALAKDPQKRPQTALDFKTQILQALGKSHKRQSWSTNEIRNRKAGLALLHLSWIMLLVSMLLIARDTQRNDSTLTNAPPPKPSKKTIISRDFQAAKVLKNCIDFSYLSNRSSMSQGLKLVSEIDQIIAKLKPADKELLFMCYYEKADLLRHLGFYDESLLSMRKALDYCRLANGDITAESINCFSEISKIHMQKGNFAEARKAALNGIELHKKTFDNESGTFCKLDIPQAYDQRRECATHECYRTLAELAEQDKKTELALNYRMEEEKHRLISEEEHESSETIKNIANLTWQLKGKAAALELMKVRLRELNTIAAEKRRRRLGVVEQVDAGQAGPGEIVTYDWMLSRAYKDLGSWYVEHGLKQEGLICYKLGKEYSAPKCKDHRVSDVYAEIIQLEKKALTP